MFTIYRNSFNIKPNIIFEHYIIIFHIQTTNQALTLRFLIRKTFPHKNNISSNYLPISLFIVILQPILVRAG